MREYEYSHVGIQIERVAGLPTVTGIVKGSPADRAGIHLGDVLESVDGFDIMKRDLLEVVEMLEGPPGSAVRLVLRRGDVEIQQALRRERLL